MFNYTAKCIISNKGLLLKNIIHLYVHYLLLANGQCLWTHYVMEEWFGYLYFCIPTLEEEGLKELLVIHISQFNIFFKDEKQVLESP